MIRSPNVLLYELDADRAALFAAAARARNIAVVCCPVPDLAPECVSSAPQDGVPAAGVALERDGQQHSPMSVAPPGSSSFAKDALSVGAAAPREGPVSAIQVAVIVVDDTRIPPTSADANAGDSLAATASRSSHLRATLRAILEELARRGIPGLVWGLRHPPAEVSGHVDFAVAETSLDELFGRLMTLARYGPLVARMEREIVHLERLGRQLNRYFAEVDQELRLAGRLQRDFLPRDAEPFPGLRCAALFQPATWVSGDMYDLFPIDQQHVGVFVADAMGHGLAAGIMTMFLRQVLHTGHLPGDVGALDPATAMARLHTGLCRQTLPNQHFVTAVYAAIDLQTFEMRLARGGHPYPVVVTRDGELRELRPDGALLGVHDLPADFQEVTHTLAPGEKLVLYTDGLEEVLLVPSTGQSDETQFSPLFREIGHLRADRMIEALRSSLDRMQGSLHQADDMTIVVVERTQ